MQQPIERSAPKQNAGLMAQHLRVLVVDDAPLFRRAIEEACRKIPHVEVIGSASNGRLALAAMERSRPDVVTLDMEMPELDGLGVLRELRHWPASAERVKPTVLALSSHTKRGSKLTIEALELGALDFITKPEGQSFADSLSWLAGKLAEAFAQVRTSRARRSLGPSHKSIAAVSLPPPARPLTRKPRAVLIGVSTGGPQALAKLLPQFPREFPLPILVVQHMPPVFTGALANSLASKCQMTVREAVQGQIARPGEILLAPGGQQMKVRSTLADTLEIVLTDDPPEQHCKPSVDYLFRHAALQLSGACIAAVLTGMGKDGAEGLRLLRRANAFTIAQDEESCIVYGMPKEAVALGAALEILPLDSIAARVIEVAHHAGKAGA